MILTLNRWGLSNAVEYLPETLTLLTLSLWSAMIYPIGGGQALICREAKSTL